MVKMIPTDKLARLIGEACSDRYARRALVRQIEDQALGELANSKLEQPENMAFATIALLLPSMLQDPRVSCSSSGDYQGRFVAVASSAAANQVLSSGGVSNQFQSAAWDYGFGWSVMFTESAATQRSDPTDAERATLGGDWAAGIASPTGPSMPALRMRPEWPVLKHIHPDKFFHDTKARSKSEWTFLGHVNVERRDALLERASEDATWRRSEIEQLVTTNNAEALGYALGAGGRVEDREELAYFVVYEPGAVLPDRPPGPWEYGVIRTLAPRGMASLNGRLSVEGAVEIREPYYFHGHPEGPYTHEGQYINTRDSFPFTALQANWKSVEMLNAAAVSLYQRIREHTIKFAYDAAQADSIERIKAAPDGAWVPVQNLKDAAIQPIETGGPSPAEVRELALLQARTATALALDDIMRGQVDGEATATAIKQVALTTNKRAHQLIRNWNRFVAGACERVVAHIVSSERFFIRLDEAGRDDHRRAVLEAAMPILSRAAGVDLPSSDVERMIERTRPIGLPLVGGDFAKQPAAWWDLKISVRVSDSTEVGGVEATMREQAINDALAWFAAQMVAQPHVNWKQRAREYFSAVGSPGVERLLDEQRASALVQMQLASADPVITTETGAGGTPRPPDLIPGAQVTSARRGPEPALLGGGQP